jgi:hypothetical protein
MAASQDLDGDAKLDRTVNYKWAGAALSLPTPEDETRRL